MLQFLVLVVGAVVVIWRGMRTKSDSTNNKARGGGPEVPTSTLLR